MKKNLWPFLLIIISLTVLAACSPQTVEVTRVVTETEMVEVTRVVDGERTGEHAGSVLPQEVSPCSYAALVKFQFDVPLLRNSYTRERSSTLRKSYASPRNSWTPTDIMDTKQGRQLKKA